MYIYLDVCKQMTDVKLLLLHSNTWNYLNVSKQMIDIKLLHSNNWNQLTVYKRMSSGLFKNVIKKICLQIINI